MKRISLVLLSLISLFQFTDLSGQISTDNRTLFVIGGEDVKVSEFEYVYTKNNISGDADYSKASLDEYLKLYVNFRLKVMEAESRGLDTVTAINQELDGYRKQLSKSYLTDKTIFDQLVSEAYSRMQKEIHVSHIMIQVEEDAFPEDTLAAYKRILDVRNRLLKGEDFTSVAKLFSDDKSVKSNGGDLGFLTVFQTVYPFENAIYNTKIGEINQPVRTQFGYHVLKVEEIRESRGSIQIAQLLRKFPKDATDTDLANINQRVFEIYKEIASGSITFEDAVKQYSEDNQTKNKGGLLLNPFNGTNWFETGQLFNEIDEVAFKLSKDELSEPVKTDIGWHILKVKDKRGIQPFDEVKNQLKVKVERDARSRIAQNVMLNNIKKDYGFREYSGSLDEMYSKVPPEVMDGEWPIDEMDIFNKPLFNFVGKDYMQADFVNYLEANIRKVKNTRKDDLLNIYYSRYVEEVCFRHEEAQLEKKDPYFKALMKEYRDGILLFELTDEMVWTKAIKDTTGLTEFHEKNRDKYLWTERADLVKFECKDKETAALVRKLAVKKSANDVRAKVNKKIENGVLIRLNKYEKGQDEQLDQMNWAPGLSKDFENSNGTITILQIKSILPAGPKKLNEAKGYVVSDYQEYLEKNWVQELRSKYLVEIKDEVFNSLIKKD